MNKCIFMGRVTKDSEVRYVDVYNSLAVARNSMAIDRGKDKDGNDRGADFINLVAFGRTAEFCEKFMTKGRRFLIESHVQTGSYTNQEGNKVYTTDFVIDRIEFADAKPEGTVAANASAASDSNFMNLPDGIDEELPFN